MKMRINYDDDQLTVIDKVNVLLRQIGFELNADGLPHDGFEVVTLSRVPTVVSPTDPS